MLGQHVRRIVGPSDFQSFEVAFSDAVLHPQISRRKMADLAEPTPAAYPNGGSSISEHRLAQLDA